jgi:hypothetical protein
MLKMFPGQCRTQAGVLHPDFNRNSAAVDGIESKRLSKKVSQEEASGVQQEDGEEQGSARVFEAFAASRYDPRADDRDRRHGNQRRDRQDFSYELRHVTVQRQASQNRHENHLQRAQEKPPGVHWNQ